VCLTARDSRRAKCSSNEAAFEAERERSWRRWQAFGHFTPVSKTRKVEERKMANEELIYIEEEADGKL